MSESAFEVETGEAVTLVRFTAETLIEHDFVKQVGDQLFALQEEHADKHFLLSFHQVFGLSSAMLGKLITLHRRTTRAEKHLAICDLEPVVLEMFQSSRLTDFFNIFDEPQAALTFLKQQESS